MAGCCAASSATALSLALTARDCGSSSKPSSLGQRTITEWSGRVPAAASASSARHVGSSRLARPRVYPHPPSAFRAALSASSCARAVLDSVTSDGQQHAQAIPHRAAVLHRGLERPRLDVGQDHPLVEASGVRRQHHPFHAPLPVDHQIEQRHGVGRRVRRGRGAITGRTMVGGSTLRSPDE